MPPKRCLTPKASAWAPTWAPDRSRASVSALALAALVPSVALIAGEAHAEKADRQKPLTIEADRNSTIDLARKVVVFDGRVVLTQGTLRMTADRVEVTEVAEGQRTAVAKGLPDAPATFREKRDGVDETVEGRAQTIEYDSREDLIRLSGKAVVRRLRGTQLADEFSGETIVWNGAKEFFSVLPLTSGAATAGAPGAAGTADRRVRAIFTPDPAKQEAVPASPPPAPAPRR